ncbi:hypothetical protein MC885_011400, partial [Smutsia gigantea]
DLKQIYLCSSYWPHQRTDPHCLCLLIMGWAPREDEPKESQELALPRAQSSISAAYSKRFSGTEKPIQKVCTSCHFSISEDETKLTWRSQEVPTFAEPQKTHMDEGSLCILLCRVTRTAVTHFYEFSLEKVLTGH